MRLFIVRHGETDWNTKQLLQGHSDTNLSEVGMEQSKKLAKALEKYPLDKIYCSDLKRCKQTIAPFLKLHKDIPIKYTSELRERNFGRFEGKKKEEMIGEFKEKGYTLNTIKIPGVESFMEVRKRISCFVEKIFKKEKGKNILLVMHGGIKFALMMELFKLDLDWNNTKYKAGNTAISIIDIKEDGNHEARLLNSVDHL